MNTKGKIHSFDTFGTVDGPGIRFVIFMQGCLFRCLYCHNPDTWNIDGGNEYTAQAVFDKIKNYNPYFKASGGGVTISGGEPLLQIDFLLELFKLCKQHDVHTAIDTNGYVDVKAENLNRLLDYTDLVLLDIKQMDDAKHRNLTGYSNLNTLTFAKHLDSRNIPIWLRYVVVPGFTTHPTDIIALKKCIAGLGNIEKVELLPFHQMGKHKWEQLELEYPLSLLRPASENDMESIRKLLKI